MRRGLALLLLVAAAASACQQPRPRAATGPSRAARLELEQERSAERLSRLERERAQWPEDRALLRDAAQAAWAVLDRGYRPNGFVTIDPDYPYATMWDIGSMLAAFHAARGLNLITQPDYEQREAALLTTLSHVPLTKHHLFNKAYDIRTGAMAKVGGGEGSDAGWSATDLGRLLVWLKIVSATPRLAALASTVVSRNDFGGVVVRDGYLRGEARDRSGREIQYGEGVIGYEQYAARGFALWGLPVAKAESLTQNALPIDVMGQPLYADYRRYDRLTSEPFLLWGLELGWTSEAERFARTLLRAQEERYRKTGALTIVGEDAMSEPPYYFYYYCVYTNGMDFALDAQDRVAAVDNPRWVSAKSAFAYHALMPTAYTDTAIRALAAAKSPRGWASGVYEGTGRSTVELSINTAAVILEAALVDETGTPLLGTGAAN